MSKPPARAGPLSLSRPYPGPCLRSSWREGHCHLKINTTPVLTSASHCTTPTTRAEFYTAVGETKGATSNQCTNVRVLRLKNINFGRDTACGQHSTAKSRGHTKRKKCTYIHISILTLTYQYWARHNMSAAQQRREAKTGRHA